MNFRIKFSVILIVLGIMAAIMSFHDGNYKGLSPNDILNLMNNNKHLITADKLAYFISEADSAIQIIDIRHPDKFRKANLPGAMNLPFTNLFYPENEPIFDRKDLDYIIVGDGDQLSVQAWILAMQAGYQNTLVLKGGMDEWDSIIMLSEFKGDRITARENALFETRYKARRLFNQWNSMPDSLKAGFFEVKKKKEKELVGGCE